MSFFNSLLQSKGISKHDGRPLWKYMLTAEEFEKLRKKLKYEIPVYLDPRDIALYYSQWWKKNYNGGTPNKYEIFQSLKGNLNYRIDENEFFKLAKKGAKMLGVKWIKKQNTLYFRSLLVQGGLPLLHISKNHGKYENFLIAVLEEQPETIEDFIFKPHIVELLPPSSQNDIIYESCFEIVKSILNKEDYYDILFNEDENLKKISETLKVKEKSLVRKQRLVKPKNYWILSFKKKKIEIGLRIGLANTYNPESLSSMLGFEASGKEYQLYVDEELICVFQKMLNGNYKTDWFQQQNQKWNGESNLPYTYVINDGVKFEVTDFIQTIPNLNEPSLWSKFSGDEWRLIKGNGTSNKEAAILFPTQWNCDLPSTEISISNEQLSWLIFEGEVQINRQDEVRKFLSEVNSFEWTIVSQKPAWILRASMPVVQKKPTILVYDENDKVLPGKKYKTWVRKHNSKEDWEELSILSYIPIGCIDVKIEKDELIAYDKFFNLNNLQAVYTNKAIDKAKIEIRHKDVLEFKLDESPILEIEQHSNNFSLEVKTEYSKIPTSIKGSVGHRNQKKLFFEMTSPFEGMAIVDKDGRLIAEDEQLYLANLYGLRILSTPNKETVFRIRNRIKRDVIISKEINESSQPIISFRNEIARLYYLSDAMDYRNKVCLEIVEGRSSKVYEISGFSHTLNVDEQFQNKVCLYGSEDELDLYAIPLNCSVQNIDLIPLTRDESHYLIPKTEFTNQFIVISSKENEIQLMPRFVNTTESIEVSEKEEQQEQLEKEERIENYHTQLLEARFQDEIWKQLLSYFNICVENELPFSTFDQLRAISRSSEVAARAFLFLGINQEETDSFIQNTIPEMEKDLGFCFHWINSDNWQVAIDEIVQELYQGKFFYETLNLLMFYMQEHNMDEVFKFITQSRVDQERILRTDIRDLRGQLGKRVLDELPYASPKITNEYNIAIEEHKPVKLLLRAPIAVAESICNTQEEHPIWAGDSHRDSIRRNIQYSQYLNPEFYKKTILHVLSNN